MKAAFISYNQAMSEMVMNIIDKQRLRGYTQWENVLGRGSFTGEPHFGTHTWPALNHAILTITKDEKIEPLLEALRDLNSKAEEQGIRAFVWNIEDQL